MTQRDIETVVQQALDDAVIEPFFAIELNFDSAPIRLWTGTGESTIDGQTYIGTGNLLDISSVEETSEMAVKGATITLSGMSSEVISLALQSPYQGRVCNIYFGLLIDHDNWILNTGSWNDLGEWVDVAYWQDGEVQAYASLTQIFSGYMDEMNITEGPDFGTIELKVENKLIDLERQRVRRFTNQYQKSVYPGDRGLEFVENIQDKEIVWGRSVN